MTAGLRRQANAIGERIDDSVGSGLGAGGVLAGDDLGGPDGEAVPVTNAAEVDAIYLDSDTKTFRKKCRASTALNSMLWNIRVGQSCLERSCCIYDIATYCRQGHLR